MSREVLARLFQPFVQADATLDRSRAGLGLGLALVRGLVELHEGEVRAHSDGPGKGALFVVSLPLEIGDEERPRASVAASAPPPRRVLVIDDNADAADSLRDLLELSGHEVAVAYDGFTGIDKARELRPDVVLCDLGLPGLDGYDVARAMRADPVLAETRLVALSGHAFPEDLQRSAEAGFEQHLTKPPRIEKLAELLGSAGAGH
jgi:CheY-like chemotaxis protein